MELVHRILFSGFYVFIYVETMTTSIETEHTSSSNKAVESTDWSMVNSSSDISSFVSSTQPMELSSRFVTSLSGITKFIDSSKTIESSRSVISPGIDKSENPSQILESSPFMITSSGTIEPSSAHIYSTVAESSILLLTSSEVSQFESFSKIVKSTSVLYSTLTNSVLNSLSVETPSDRTTVQTSVIIETSDSKTFLSSDYSMALSSSISINCTWDCFPHTGKSTDSGHTSTVIVAVMFCVILLLILVGTVVYWRKRRCGHYGIRTPVATYKIFRDDDSERVTLN